MNYNPEQLHYGSVSVGGVTTGGFYKTGGNYTTSNVKKSGYKRLCYTGQGIVSIKLTDELLNQAKEDSNISKFIEVDKIQIIGRSSSLNHDYLSYTNNRSFSIGLETGIPEQDCRQILFWICGGNETFNCSAEGWKCPKCGRTNQGFMENCFDCGKKRPSEMKNRDIEKDKNNNNDKPEIDYLADKWKCPDCGKANPNSITFCSCGKTKPE